jgi:hypothetical protein
VEDSNGPSGPAIGTLEELGQGLLQLRQAPNASQHDATRVVVQARQALDAHLEPIRRERV